MRVNQILSLKLDRLTEPPKRIPVTVCVYEVIENGYKFGIRQLTQVSKLEFKSPTDHFLFMTLEEREVRRTNRRTKEKVDHPLAQHLQFLWTEQPLRLILLKYNDRCPKRCPNVLLEIAHSGVESEAKQKRRSILLPRQPIGVVDSTLHMDSRNTLEDLNWKPKFQAPGRRPWVRDNLINIRQRPENQARAISPKPIYQCWCIRPDE